MAVRWFQKNEIIVNSDKFQAIIILNKKGVPRPHKLII